MSRTLVVEVDGGVRGVGTREDYYRDLLEGRPSNYGRGRGNAACAGLVLELYAGDVLAEFGVRVGRCTTNEAEYHGVLNGLELAMSLDRNADIVVFSDALAVMRQLRHFGARPSRSEAVRALRARIMEMTKGRRVTYIWWPRRYNSRADALVHAVFNDTYDSPIRVGQSNARIPTGIHIDALNGDSEWPTQW